MAIRRSPWLDDRAALLVRTLKEGYGLTISEDVAREDVSAHVDYVASVIGVGRRAAKRYVTEEVIIDLAANVAQYVQTHRDAIRDRVVADLDVHRRRRFPTPRPPMQQQQSQP